MSRRPTLIITPGDATGIGPEVTTKALSDPTIARLANFVIIGAEAPWKRSRIKKLPNVRFVHPPVAPSKKNPVGYASGWSIQTAVEKIHSKEAQALVTGPINKTKLRAGGFKYDGHTGFLAKLTQQPNATMMLANPKLQVSLVTTHLPLERVSKKITSEKIERAVSHTLDYLGRHCRIKNPRILVTGLNPHAGEGGLLGEEEQKLIAPTLRKIQKKVGRGRVIEGPLPADTVFAREVGLPKNKRAHAILAMYHDQGLAPVKMIDFDNTVNITLGLPIIRTSVDHGTAEDIFGKNKANASSMKAAIKKAVAMVRAEQAAQKGKRL